MVRKAVFLDRDGVINANVKRDGLAVAPTRLEDFRLLPGVTRDTVLTLAQRLGIPVKEQMLPREVLYVADEVFMTGTAAEITPVRSVDKITVGRGVRGEMTEALQKAFFDVIECRVPDEFGWLTFVREVGAAGAVPARGKRSTG